MAKNLIMVMGVQRSGTTALFRSLASDKTLTAVDESIESAIYHRYQLRPLPEIAHVLNGAPGTVLLKPVSETFSRTIGSIFEEYEAYSLRVIWIYRDPVNVLYSMHRHGWVPLCEIDSSVNVSEWERRNRSALQSHQERPDKIAILRYEDCLLDPHVFQSLTTWLGLKSNSLFRKDSSSGRKNVPLAAQQKIDAATRDISRALHAARTFRARAICRLKHGAANKISEFRGKRPTAARSRPGARGPFDWNKLHLPEPVCLPSSLAGLKFWLDASVQKPGEGALALQNSGLDHALASDVSNGLFHLPYLNGKHALFFPTEKVAVRRENASGILRLGTEVDWTFLFNSSPFTVFALFRPKLPNHAPYRQQRAVLLHVASNDRHGPAFVLEWDRPSSTSQAMMMAEDDDKNAIARTPEGSHPHQEWRIIQVLHKSESGGTLSISANAAAGSAVDTMQTRKCAVKTLLACTLELGGTEGEIESLFYGAVAEIIIFNRALSTSEQFGLTRYLKEKYQL